MPFAHFSRCAKLLWPSQNIRTLTKIFHSIFWGDGASEGIYLLMFRKKDTILRILKTWFQILVLLCILNTFLNMFNVLKVLSFLTTE